jgi:hypothetical protein
VPVERIELPTFGLQNRCSTAELNRRLIEFPTGLSLSIGERFGNLDARRVRSIGRQGFAGIYRGLPLSTIWTVRSLSVLSPVTVNTPCGTEVTRVVARVQRLRVATLYDLNPDCSVIGIPTVRILEPSKDGGIIVEKGGGFPNFPVNNSRSKCNSNAVDGEVIFYIGTWICRSRRGAG